jgi:hypothetical protein
VLQRLERWGVSYIIGLQKNSRLNAAGGLAELALAEQYSAKQTKQRMFGEFPYAAGTWDKPRRVIARLEHGEQGANPRFIVTDLQGSPKALYDAGTAPEAKPRTGSRKRSSICSAAVRVATASRPTSFGCCWRRWPTP